MNLTRTPRTKVTRTPKRASYDRTLLNQIIAEAMVGHLAFNSEGCVHSIPLLFWYDSDFLYSHCSVKSRLTTLVQNGGDVCVSFTILDGLVLAKSAFRHSVNYRSAVIYGQCQLVENDVEKLQALKHFMDNVHPKRWELVRQPNRRELNATSVFKIPLEEAAVKIRHGPPVDKKMDQQLAVWSGTIPYLHERGKPEPDQFS